MPPPGFSWLPLVSPVFRALPRTRVQINIAWRYMSCLTPDSMGDRNQEEINDVELWIACEFWLILSQEFRTSVDDLELAYQDFNDVRDLIDCLEAHGY